ncbi:cbb3-type cytochrome c oxidase subunit I [Candidatus Protochlamydia phocaeensis]|uniref:cbb3-type cytochrome c oxidase subunit I n=1 Tax=Candidatus Protochlamydia phocaeensis TaxID=1414722 RepID=UPI0008381204
MFGKLTLDALPHHWYTIGATVFIVLMGIAAAIILTKTKRWGWLWKEWLTSTDPKKIGTMYILFAALMFFRGLVDAGMIWLQQAIAADSQGYLSADHFQQIFTAHGDIMVFFVTMGFFFGLMNWIVPLQIGARDLAFPFLNSLGLWLTIAGGALINLFFMIGGDFANTGWLAFAPLSELEFNPGVGVDYLIWSLQLSGLGSLLAAINFIVTIIKKRAPGMTLMKTPLFIWTSFCGMILIISAFPVLTATTLLLWLDRFLDMHFFTTGFGGNQMMYFNLIWMWGHPEVYILVLPAFGMFSEIVATFSQKKISGYVSMVWAALAITFLSYLVWLHHFFTMGAGASVNSFFGIVTMLIAIPSGVQVFNWILTMFKGQVHFASPMYWFMGFIVLFCIGGMAGVLMAAPPADFQVHNSLFLIAHFHTMIVGVALFGIFAGITYWFPKIMGFKLDERLGKRAFWLWLIGFFVSFLPLYLLGFMGATRRLDHYSASTGWQPLYLTALLGFILISCGILTQVIQIIVSIRERKQLRDVTGDPWNGRTLEWATASPPPFYNFAVIPTVTSREEFWSMKKEGRKPSKQYKDLLLPRYTGMGIYISGFAFLLGFALVWHILWLFMVGLAGAIACVIRISFDEEMEYVLPAAEVARIEQSMGRGA